MQLLFHHGNVHNNVHFFCYKWKVLCTSKNGKLTPGVTMNLGHKDSYVVCNGHGINMEYSI